MKQGILSFKGTVGEFRLFLQGLSKDLDEGLEPSQAIDYVRKSA